MKLIKTIAHFREKNYGLFIDLSDPVGHIGVDRESGDILLDEGIGEDRYHGAVIRAASFRNFSLEQLEQGSWRLLLRFGERDSHEIGVTTDFVSANRWVEVASQAIQSRQRDDSQVLLDLPRISMLGAPSGSSEPTKQAILSAPQLRRSVNIFSDAVHLVHPPVNYSQFQHRPELDRLMTWASDSRDRVCIVLGSGGSGKTTLATQLLLSLCPGSIAGSHPTSSHFRTGFYYSFYADPRPKNFLQALWHWLKPGSKHTPLNRPKWFASLREARHCLLVLDGIEALSQEAMLAKMNGFSLQELFGGIKEGTVGTARWLITSRNLESLANSVKATVIALDPLPENSSLSLLRSHGVDGDEKILRLLVRALGNHPLTLDLAGHYIREFGWDEAWTSWLPKNYIYSKTSDPVPRLGLETISNQFINRLAKESPETTTFLAGAISKQVEHQRTYVAVVPANWPAVNTERTTKFTWGLDLLMRSGIVTIYTQHHGKVGRAEGGAANYQFEPEKDQSAKQRVKVFFQPNKIGTTLRSFINKTIGKKKVIVPHVRKANVIRAGISPRRTKP